jgi:hypothetical protein
MSLGHFGTGYWNFLRKIQSVESVPCQDSPEIFFPDDFPEPRVRLVATAAAKALCNSCPIKNDCFEYAIESKQRYGIWAGTTPSERSLG